MKCKNDDMNEFNAKIADIKSKYKSFKVNKIDLCKNALEEDYLDMVLELINIMKKVIKANKLINYEADNGQKAEELIMPDENFICKDCGANYVLEENEIAWYAERNMQLPKRCKTCRQIKRQENQNRRGGNNRY